MLLREIRLWFRTLRRNPLYTLGVVLALSFGCGGNIALFFVTDAVLLRPLPYSKDAELVMLWSPLDSHSLGAQHFVDSYPDFLDWQRRNRTFTGLTAYNVMVGEVMFGKSQELLAGAGVAPNFFHVLGVQPAVGRDFQDADGKQKVMIVSHGLWRGRLGGTSSVIGSKLLLSGEPYTVIGVAPPSFEQPEPFWSGRAQFWIPVESRPGQLNRNDRQFRVTGRLRPGISLKSAQSEMAIIAQQLENEFPQTNRNRTVQVISLRTQLFGHFYRPILLAFLGALVVLLIACANAATLQVARLVSRNQEIAIRCALGASRSQLGIWALGESFLLACFGMAGGLLFAWGVGRGLLLSHMPFEIVHRIGIDFRALVFALLLVILVMIFIGILPLMHALGYFKSMRPMNRYAEYGEVKRRPWRGAIVVFQLVFLVPLLVTAILLSRSFYKLTHVDTGFGSDRILTFRVFLAPTQYPEIARVRDLVSRIKSELVANTQILSVAATSAIPLTSQNTQYWRGISTAAGTSLEQSLSVFYRVVTEDFFETMRMPLEKGRTFTPADNSMVGQKVAVVNALLAERLWPNEDPIGKRLHIEGIKEGDGWVSVVGVVRNVRFLSLASEPGEEIYVPYVQDSWRNVSIVVHTSGDPMSVLTWIRSRLAGVDSALRLQAPRTMNEILLAASSEFRFAALTATASAAFALLLAVIGVSGVTAYLIIHRRKEFGIRIALGAKHSDIVRYIVGYGLKLGIVGSVIGTAMSLSGVKLLSHFIYATRPTDVISFSGGVVLLLLTVIFASYIPARAVAHIHPAVTLRVD